MITALVALVSLLLGVGVAVLIVGCVLVSQLADLKAYTMTVIDLLQPPEPPLRPPSGIIWTRTDTP
jgi:hypothetical protein